MDRCVRRQHTDTRPGTQLPEPQRLVDAASREVVRVRVEGHRVHVRQMPTKTNLVKTAPLPVPYQDREGGKGQRRTQQRPGAAQHARHSRAWRCGRATPWRSTARAARSSRPTPRRCGRGSRRGCSGAPPAPCSTAGPSVGPPQTATTLRSLESTKVRATSVAAYAVFGCAEDLLVVLREGAGVDRAGVAAQHARCGRRPGAAVLCLPAPRLR